MARLSPQGAPLDWPRKSARRFWRAVCSPVNRHPDSLYWFMRKVFGMDAFMRANPSKQWFVRRVHKPYCRWKQDRYYRFFDAYKAGQPCRVKMVSMLPRGFLKSTINAGTQIWAHLENPDFATRMGAADDELALDLFAPVKQTYGEGDSYSLFGDMYGAWRHPKRTWRRFKLVHAWRENTAKKEPSFAMWTVKRGFTGHHPEIATMDDSVTREKLKEEGGSWIEAAKTAVDSARYAMPECSLFEQIGTRYHDDDPIGHFTRREGVRSWDGEECDDGEINISPRGEWEVYFLGARDMTTGEAVAPEIATTDDLNRAEASNSVLFWSQMMNRPAKGDHLGLDISQINELWVDPEHVPPGEYIIVCDTAFKDPSNMNQTNALDESVFEIWKRDGRPSHADYYYVFGYGSRTDRVEDFTEALVVKLQEYQSQRKRVTKIVDERPPGKSGAWFHYLKNICNSKGVICPPTLELARGGRKKSQKIGRIRVAAGFWADGRVKIVKGAPNAHRLIAQMTRFDAPGNKHDDWADAAADLFHPLVYRVMVPFGQDGGGRRQVGPDDDTLVGDGYRENTGSQEVFDTIFGDEYWT